MDEDASQMESERCDAPPESSALPLVPAIFKSVRLEIHLIADIFPTMRAEEFEALNADIFLWNWPSG